MFAPGHRGDLTQIVPFDLADAVLAETGTVQRKLRMLPSRVGLYFLLAMCLFPTLGYLKYAKTRFSAVNWHIEDPAAGTRPPGSHST